MTTTSSRNNFLPGQRVSVLLKAGEIKVTPKITLKIPEGFSEKIMGQISENDKTRIFIPKEAVISHGLVDNESLENIGVRVIIPLSACSHAE